MAVAVRGGENPFRQAGARHLGLDRIERGTAERPTLCTSFCVGEVDAAVDDPAGAHRERFAAPQAAKRHEADCGKGSRVLGPRHASPRQAGRYWSRLSRSVRRSFASLRAPLPVPAIMPWRTACSNIARTIASVRPPRRRPRSPIRRAGAFPPRFHGDGRFAGGDFGLHLFKVAEGQALHRPFAE